MTPRTTAPRVTTAPERRATPANVCACPATPTAPHSAPQGAPALAITLPTPPSVNNLFADRPNGKGRMKTRAYLSWEAEARYAARWPRISEDKTNTIRWRCRIVAHDLPRTRDIDNLSKSICDFICTMTGLCDNYLDYLTLERGEGDEACVEVAVWLLPEVAR